MRPAPLVLLLALAVGCGGEDPDAGAGESPGASAGAAGGATAVAVTGAGVEDYRLRMDAVERWHRAQRNLYRRVERDPALAQRLRELDLGSASVNDLEAHLSSLPSAREAIREAGLEPREFVVILFSLYHASLAYAVEEMGGDAGAQLGTEVHPANLEFVRENQARLQQLQAETEAIEPPELGEAEDDDRDGDGDGEYGEGY